MKLEDCEDFIDIQENSKIHMQSYVSKKVFIEIIENLNFTHILSADLHFITAFEHDCEKNITKPLGFDIHIA